MLICFDIVSTYSDCIQVANPTLPPEGCGFKVSLVFEAFAVLSNHLTCVPSGKSLRPEQCSASKSSCQIFCSVYQSQYTHVQLSEFTRTLYTGLKGLSLSPSVICVVALHSWLSGTSVNLQLQRVKTSIATAEFCYVCMWVC